MSDSQNHESFMQAAIDLAVDNMNAGRGGPFGCVIVKDNKIIAQGTNCVTSKNDPTAHAEVQAIRQACTKLGSFQLSECDIYTSCEPCPMCLGAIYWARPHAVYYSASREDAARGGFDDDFIYQEISKPLAARKYSLQQVLPQKGPEPFALWLKKADKIDY